MWLLCFVSLSSRAGFQGRLPFSRPFVFFWPRLPSRGFFAPYIALFFDATGIVLASGTSPNSHIGRFGAVYSANSLIWPCDMRLLARKKFGF